MSVLVRCLSLSIALLALLWGPPAAAADAPEPPPPIGEPPLTKAPGSAGRAELIVSQGLVAPLWFGTAIPVYDPESTTAERVALMVMLGIGVGLGAPYALTTRYRVSSGQAMTLYTAEIMGGWYGLWLEGALTDQPITGRASHLGVLLGAGAGVGLLRALPDVSAGDVALVRSGALWGTGFSGVLLLLLADEPTSSEAFATLGVGTTVGVGSAMALTGTVNLTRGQVNLVNLGGYAGLLTAGTVLLFTRPENPRSVAGVLGLGGAMGLTAGALLVRDGARRRANRGVRLPPAGFAILRDSDGRAHPGLQISGAW